MSLGTPEIIIIFVLVLILFGPSRLPDLARTVGRGMRELRKASAEIQSHFNLDDDDDARNPSWREARREASHDARDLPPRDEPAIADYEPYGALPRNNATFDDPAHDDLAYADPARDALSHDAAAHDVAAHDPAAWHEPISETTYTPSETQPSPAQPSPAQPSFSEPEPDTSEGAPRRTL